MSQEASLASAILYLALEDAVAASFTKEMTRTIRDTATQFCTDATGHWARSREAWCHVAGIDPDAFRERATRKIAATRAALANGAPGRVAGRRLLVDGVGA